jgi:DNA-binding LacI/PurR family transcriptional regulator
VISEARQRGLAVVADGRPSADAAGIPYVHSDMQQSLGLVLTHLIEAGARRIGLLTGPELDAYTLDTEQAYAAWSAERGQAPAVALRRWWRAWSTAPPPTELQVLIDAVTTGQALNLYSPA